MKHLVFLLFASLSGIVSLVASEPGAPAGIVLYAETPKGVVLLLADHEKPSKRGWAAFGGQDEPGETPAQTAARETEEETHGYFKREALLKELENQKPFLDGAFALYFVKVDQVSIEKLLATPIPGDSPYHERGPFAWIPYSEVTPHLDHPPEGKDSARVNPKLIPENRNTAWFWTIWLSNMRAAREAGAIPWIKKTVQVSAM